MGFSLTISPQGQGQVIQNRAAGQETKTFGQKNWEEEVPGSHRVWKRSPKGKSSLILCVKHHMCLEQTQRSITKTLRNDLALDHHPQKARQNVQPEPNRLIA